MYLWRVLQTLWQYLVYTYCGFNCDILGYLVFKPFFVVRNKSTKLWLTETHLELFVMLGKLCYLWVKNMYLLKYLSNISYKYVFHRATFNLLFKLGHFWVKRGAIINGWGSGCKSVLSQVSWAIARPPSDPELMTQWLSSDLQQALLYLLAALSFRWLTR